MSQILHIFRKDTRRMWLELLLSMLVMATMVWLYPSEWQVAGGASERGRTNNYVLILTILLTVSWWLLIARAVQAEALVGEQQFWITRPYEWWKLLATKVLFVAAWIGVPYTAAQLYLLHVGGFPALVYSSGLLANLGLLAVVLLVPMFAMAAVTSNFARLALSALGVLIVVFVFQYVTHDLPNSGYTASMPYRNVFQIPLLFAGCAAAIGLEYATRRTWIARGLLLAVPALMAVSAYAYSRQYLVDRAYPRPGSGAAPVNIRLDKQPTATRSFAGEDYTNFALDYSGVAAGTALFGDDFKFTIVGADGSQWTSPWQSIEDRFVPGQGEQREGLNLMMRPEVYERYKQGPVTLRITFALTRYQADAVMNTVYPERETAIPGIGMCAPQRTRTQSLYCRAPLGGPQLTRMTVDWSSIPCELPQPTSDAASHGDQWLVRDGPTFFLNSVWNMDLWFGDERSHTHVCPGSPLTVTHYHPLDRTQMEVTFQNVVLPGRVDPT